MAENERLGSAWVRRPAAGEPAEIDIKVPDGSGLAALETLLGALADRERKGQGVTAEMVCDKKGSCQPIVDGECAWHVSCRIV